MTSKPIVAVVGAGTWRPDDLPEDRWKIVGNAPATLSANSTPANYWAGIIQAVRLVAPDVRFISSTAAGADGELSKDSISESVADVLSAEPRPDILLATFGPFNDKTIEDLFAQAARQGVLVVIPAGNDRSAPIPFAGNPALPDLMIGRGDAGRQADSLHPDRGFGVLGARRGGADHRSADNVQGRHRGGLRH